MGGRIKGRFCVTLAFFCLLHRLSLTPPALFSQLPDFIVGDLFLAFTINPSAGLLAISETVRQARASFTMLAGSQGVRMPCRKGQRGKGDGRMTSSVSPDPCICASAVQPEAKREGDKPGHVRWGRLAGSPCV